MSYVTMRKEGRIKVFLACFWDLITESLFYKLEEDICQVEGGKRKMLMR